MTLEQEFELNDNLIYLYIGCAFLSIFLSLIFIVIILKKWSTASLALNPAQHQFRTTHTKSLLISFVSLLLYSLIIAFGITDIIINWNFHQLSQIYKQILVFLLLFSAYTFFSFIFISYLQRVQMLITSNFIENTVKTSRVLNFVLKCIQFLWLLIAIITPIAILYDGISYGHTRDISTGIIVLRAQETILANFAKYGTFPLSIITMFIIEIIYAKQIKSSFKHFKTKRKRDKLLPVFLKESILDFIACISFIIVTLLIIIAKNIQIAQNMILLTPLMTVIMACSAFLMLNFNMTRFYKCCYFCSLTILKYVCCSYQNGDEILLKQAINEHYQYEQSPFDHDLDEEMDEENL